MISRALPIPPIAVKDESAVELLRMWAVERGQHITISAQLWEDPASWGLLLVDLAQLIADAYVQTEGRHFDTTLARIRESSEAAWDTATDPRSKSVVVDMKARELPIPCAASNDQAALELVRVWVVKGAQHFTIATVRKDPSVWGIMLVDLAKNIASAYVQAEGRSFQTVLAQIREGFGAEWDSPTDQPWGKLLE